MLPSQLQETNGFDTQQFNYPNKTAEHRSTSRRIYFRNERGRRDLPQLSPVSLDFPVLEAAMVEDC